MIVDDRGVRIELPPENVAGIARVERGASTCVVDLPIAAMQRRRRQQSEFRLR